MRLIDADALFRKVKTECNPYGKPTIGFEDGKRVMDWIEHAPTVGGWVSVKDRLPDKPCGCLAFNIYGWRALDFWEGDGWAISDENEITHWMPLPPGPEEDK